MTSTVSAIPIVLHPIQRKELDDDGIGVVMNMLRHQYPCIGGLEHPGMGDCRRGLSVPRFQAADRPFVQVINIGDHWVTVTNSFSRQDPNDVYVYDILHYDPITTPTTVQQRSILRRASTRDDMTAHDHEGPEQVEGSRLCGYYALAAAYAVCAGEDPTGRDYDPHTMVEHVDWNITLGTVDVVPPAWQSPAVDRRTHRVHKLHCYCQQPSSAHTTMIQCTAANCFKWFHVACVSVTARQLRRESVPWIGPCCSHLLPSVATPPVVIIDDDDPSQPSTSRAAPAAQDPGIYYTKRTLHTTKKVPKIDVGPTASA